MTRQSSHPAQQSINTARRSMPPAKVDQSRALKHFDTRAAACRGLRLRNNGSGLKCNSKQRKTCLTQKSARSSRITRRAAESGHRRLFCEVSLEFCDQCRERFWLFVRG